MQQDRRVNNSPNKGSGPKKKPSGNRASFKESSEEVAVPVKEGELIRKTIPTPAYKKIAGASAQFDFVFAIGPAGSGKTHNAIQVALDDLAAGKISKIIITRPAVPAEEDIGHLPGTELEKIAPYMRPIYDVLIKILGVETTQRWMDNGTIEVAPIGFMRGRTFEKCAIIADECQNLKIKQLKMLLSRVGLGSKIIVTGDLTQIDLVPISLSGLKLVSEVLSDLVDISIVQLTSTDNRRHKAVSAIVKAITKLENSLVPNKPVLVRDTAPAKAITNG